MMKLLQGGRTFAVATSHHSEPLLSVANQVEDLPEQSGRVTRCVDDDHPLRQSGGSAGLSATLWPRLSQEALQGSNG